MELAYEAGLALDGESAAADRAERRQTSHAASADEQRRAGVGEGGALGAAPAPAADEEETLRLLRALAAAYDMPSPEHSSSSDGDGRSRGLQQVADMPSWSSHRIDRLEEVAALLPSPSAASARPVTDAFTERFPAYGGGLVDRLRIMEDQVI